MRWGPRHSSGPRCTRRRRASAARGRDHEEPLRRGDDHAPVFRRHHLHRVVDEDVEDVLDVGVADEVHRQLAQGVGLRRALDGGAALALELTRHVSSCERDHEKQKHLADGRVGVDREIRGREAATDEQVQERDEQRGDEARRRAEPHRVGDDGEKQGEEEGAAESIGQVDERGREEDVEHHGAQAELLARAVAPHEDHLDGDIHHRPREQDHVDDHLGLGRALRIEVVQRREDDEEQPPEDERDSFADAAAIRVKRLVDRLGAKILPARRLLLNRECRLAHSSLRGGNRHGFKRGLMMRLDPSIRPVQRLIISSA